MKTVVPKAIVKMPAPNPSGATVSGPILGIPNAVLLMRNPDESF